MKLKKIMGFSLTTAMVLGLSVPAFAAEGEQTSEYTFYYMIDPYLVNEGFIAEPTNGKMTAEVTDDWTVGELLDLQGIQYQGSNTYITGFQCDESGFDFDKAVNKDNFPAVAFDEDIVKTNQNDGWLSAYEYTGYSGWMMTINNETQAGEGADTYYCSLMSTLGDLKEEGIIGEEGDVVLEMFFSFNMGADVGIQDAGLPTEIIGEGPGSYYNWNDLDKQMKVEKSYKADRTELIKAMADCEDKTAGEYTSAEEVLKNISADQSEVNEVADELMALEQ